MGVGAVVWRLCGQLGHALRDILHLQARVELAEEAVGLTEQGQRFPFEPRSLADPGQPDRSDSQRAAFGNGQRAIVDARVAGTGGAYLPGEGTGRTLAIRSEERRVG